MSFINERLLEGVSYGTAYGSGFLTKIHALNSGHERRNASRSVPLGTFSIIYGALLEQDHARVLSAFQTAMGRLHSFRLKDLTEFSVSSVQIGIGTGQEESYQLVRRYGFGSASSVAPVTKPVPGSVIVMQDAEEIDFEIDYMTGMVSATALPGSVVTWSGMFDKVVRFDDDDIQFTIDSRAGGLVPVLSTDISLKEVFE